MNALYGGQYTAWSAETEPSEVNPYAVRVMEEVGVDMAGHHSKSVEPFLEQDFDYFGYTLHFMVHQTNSSLIFC